jgi:hypothetical protein
VSNFRKIRFAALLAALLLGAALAQSQELLIYPEAGKKVVLSRADIEALPHTTLVVGVANNQDHEKVHGEVHADVHEQDHDKVQDKDQDKDHGKDKDKDQTTFVGVTLKALLEKASVTFGETLRGKRLASCLLVEAADGYRVVIALPEIDSAFTDKQILLAFSRNGKDLDQKEGSYRLVIPDEKRMARWVRQVTSMKIVDVQ